ncbi:AAR2-domain-containing protein [Linderina pennispora]|uniref:AAR2-domain-containing protein n=1 Tax=Linderina pennispora TaxID=61395 RepID=A0A1Y1WF05_9FUNG|nr:AAR2-domain-containing protein [Linderina pennispora]ORX71908.1 AAR2-domain-containing protein [Linderina pennispora]
MDQDTARALFEAGGCLVVLGAPAGMEFGVDLDTWETGPLFKGIKMIPPGIHYVHYSAVNTDSQAGMRSGFFHEFVSKEVVVQKWNPETELMEPVAGAEAERIKMNIRQLDANLGAYPLSTDHDSMYRRWLYLTSSITGAMLARIMPGNHAFTSATGSRYEDEEMALAQKMLARAYPHTPHPALDTDLADRFDFPHINIRRSFPAGATGTELQKYSQDKSWLLRHCLREIWHGEQELLGEFQLAFLIIFVGQNFAGFEHWKRLLHLVLGSREALKDMAADLVVPMLRVFMRQLTDCPRSFVTEVLESDNFVAQILNELVLNAYEMDVGELDQEIGRLRVFLRDRFSWTLMEGPQLQELADAEEGEYAPVVVDMG